ncbi:hypothetical protein Tco_1084028 [Tanacetum coccineum]
MKSAQLPGVKMKSTPGDPNHLIGESLKPPRDKNQRAFVGGSWSDSGEEDDEKIQDETCFAVPVFSPGDDPIACLNKAMAFLMVPKRPRNVAWYKEKAMLADAQEAGQILDKEKLVFLANPGILASQTQTVIPHNAAFQTEDLDTL